MSKDEQVLKDHARELYEALLALGKDYPGKYPCYCGRAVGQPNCSTHSPQCRKARELLQQIEEETC